MDLATENRHLEQAERGVAEGRARIERQILLIEGLRQRGERVIEAEQLLETFRQTLEGWYDHRDQILNAISRMRNDAPRLPRR